MMPEVILLVQSASHYALGLREVVQSVSRAQTFSTESL